MKYSEFVNRWDAFEALGFSSNDAWYLAKYGHCYWVNK